MNFEWIKNKTKQKFYPITHAKGVLYGSDCKSTVEKEISSINEDIKTIKPQVNNATYDETSYISGYDYATGRTQISDRLDEKPQPTKDVLSGHNNAIGDLCGAVNSLKSNTTSVVSTSANGLAPKVTDTSKFLKGDGTWATPLSIGTTATTAAAGNHTHNNYLPTSGGTMTGDLTLAYGERIYFPGYYESDGEPPVSLYNNDTSLMVRAYNGIILTMPSSYPGYVRFPVPSTASEGSYIETGTWTPIILADGSSIIPEVNSTPVLYAKSANYTIQGNLVILRTVISTEVSVSTSYSYSHIDILLEKNLPYTFKMEKFICSYACSTNPRGLSGVGKLHYNGIHIQFDSTNMPIGVGMGENYITIMYHK